MLVTGAPPRPGEQGDIRNLLPTAEARALLVRLAELSGRSLVLVANDGEEICRSDGQLGQLCVQGRGATAAVEAGDERMGLLQVLGADAEGAAGQNLARLIAACVADRAVAAAVALRSPFSPMPAALQTQDQELAADLGRILHLLEAHTGAGVVALLRRRGGAIGGQGGDLFDLLAARGAVSGANLVLRATQGPLATALEAEQAFRVTVNRQSLGVLESLLGGEELILAPMRVDGREEITGVLTLGSPASGAFAAQSCAAADEFAALAANLLDRTGRLEDGHRHLIHAIQAILETTEGGDRSRGHGTRTARFAVKVGLHMGLSESRLRDLEIAASLHDLGKIGAAGLSGDAVREQHAVWGAALLETTTTFSHLAPAVRFHHARWDGVGNPAGWSGEDLPLAARIIGACNAFEHQTAVRERGRTALNPRRALKALRNQEGAYDPAVLAALERSLRSA